MRRTCWIATLLSLMSVLSVHGQDARKEIPAKKALDDAEKTVKQVFAADYPKTKVSDRAALAKRLLDEAANNLADPAAHYVLLRDSRDLAAKAGDLPLFGAAAKELSTAFRVPAAEAFATGVDTLAANLVVAKGAEADPGMQALLDAADSGIESDSFDASAKVLKGLDAIARKTKAPEMIAAAQTRIKGLPALRKEFAGLSAAKKTLETTPTDPKANAVVGRYLCFVKGNWDMGLAHLLLGGEAKFKEAIEKDASAQTGKSPEQFAAGEAWRQHAMEADPWQKSRIESRALLWYRQAVDGATGLNKAVLDNRIKELTKSGAVAGGTIAPATPTLTGTLAYRSGAARAKLLEQWGGTKESEEAVGRGLKWLASQQSADGRWKLDGNFPDRGNANDPAATALALLPFLGSGKTHRPGRSDPDSVVIGKGIRYLAAIQDKKTGAFSREGYSHALCTIAMCEAFALTKDAELKRSAQFGINHIVAAQHSAGGWRYQPGQPGDTSVTGWMVSALKVGQLGGLDVPAATMKKATSFLDSVMDGTSDGYGYTGPTTPMPTMSAVGLLCRHYLQGWNAQTPQFTTALDRYVKPNAPKMERKDIYYYYYATQVMRHAGGADWTAWNDKMRDMLLSTQAANEIPVTNGSWAPTGDIWGRTGGRLMQTSLSLLTLEVYYRYDGVAGKSP